MHSELLLWHTPLTLFLSFAEYLQGSGSAYSKSTNKRGAVEHFDKGLGYDENDSFIDNTDAVRESLTFLRCRDKKTIISHLVPISVR